MIKRTILPQLIAHLENPEITVITGSRQSGKTTLMEQLKEQVEKNGGKTLYLNLDTGNAMSYFHNQLDFVNFAKLQLGNSKAYIFIDEMQRVENAGLFLKGLYDSHLPYKFIVSGSGSLELKEKIKESLAGRKRIFEINTISFLEFVNYKTDYRYSDKLLDFFTVDTSTSSRLLSEYLSFGGYPKVVIAETLEEKSKIIQDIYESYLERDIKDLLHIQKSAIFTQLVTLIASQIGQPVNYTELGSTLGINTETIKHYLWYLEKTFVLKRVSPHFGNMRKELTKMPIFYFKDLGMRNYALNRFSHFGTDVMSGFLFQNLIFQLLQEKYPLYKAAYWRTRDGSEVDFVLTGGVEIMPCEVKYSAISESKATIPRSVISYISSYHPKKISLINLSLKKTFKTINGTEVEFVPYYELVDN